MSTFVNNDVSSGNIVYASDHNTQGSLLAAVLNGGLDNANIATGAAIDGSKLADGGITTTKLADDAVTDAKLDYPRWWPEIGRTTLSVAGDTISVTALPARKYLMLIFNAIPSGAIAPQLRFNNDASSNYNYRYLINYSSASGATSQSSITVDPASTASQTSGEVFIINNASKEKQVTAHVSGQGTAGAANQATSIEVTGKWANTTDAISRVDLINSGGAGDFAIGSELIVLGHD